MSAHVLAFPDPDWRTPFYLRVVLVKGDFRRLYEILPGGEPDTVQTWVRWNGQAHRAQLCRSRVQVEQLAGQYAREMTALQADGWRLDE